MQPSLTKKPRLKRGETDRWLAKMAEGMTLAQIAEASGIPFSQLHQRLKMRRSGRIRRKIRYYTRDEELKLAAEATGLPIEEVREIAHEKAAAPTAKPRRQFEWPLEIV